MEQYTLEVVLDLMNFNDTDRGYYQPRSFEFQGKDDEDAICVAQDFFGAILSVKGESVCNLDNAQYCIIGILRAVLRDSEKYIVTRWVKADFDASGVMNYGSMDTSSAMRTNNVTYHWKTETTEEKIARELKEQAWENSLQEITRTYCSTNRRWKHRIRI